MNFLQLTQRLQLECGVSGSPIVTVANQTGEFARLVTWINAAWIDIQNKHEDWEWLRTSTTWPTVAGQYQYTLAQCNTSNFGMWHRGTFRNYDTAAGIISEVFMEYEHFDIWRDKYLYAALRDTRSRPYVASVGPDKSIFLGPVVTSGYTMEADYYTAPTELALDADTPALPTRFHMAIVYRAMMSYGYYESATEVVQRGTSEYRKLLSQIEADRLPDMLVGAALA